MKISINMKINININKSTLDLSNIIVNALINVYIIK